MNMKCSYNTNQYTAYQTLAILNHIVWKKKKKKKLQQINHASYNIKLIQNFKNNIRNWNLEEAITVEVAAQRRR